MKRCVLLYILFLFICACTYPIAVEKRTHGIPETRAPIPEETMVMILYLPWEHRSLADIIRLFEKNPQLKMTLGFPSGYKYFKDAFGDSRGDTEDESYKRLLSLIQEQRIEIALRLPHEPILPLIAHTDDVKDLLGERGSLPVPAYAWPADIRQQLANAREAYFETWGMFPRGFIPTGGWLSPRALKSLKDLEIEWCVSGPYDTAQSPVYTASGVPEIFFMREDIVNALYRSDAMLGNRYIAKKITDIIKESNERVTTLVFDENHYKDVYNRRIPPLIEQFADTLTAATTGMRCILPHEVIGTSPHQFGKISLKNIPLRSWQHDTFAPWIGEDEENAAWGLLAQIRKEVDNYQNSGSADINRLTSAMEEIFAAESGDYFYYFGNESDSMQKSEKEQAFKASLINIYRLINLNPPEELYHPLKDAAGYSTTSASFNDTAMEIGPGYVRWRDIQGDDHGSGDIQYPLPEQEYPGGSYDLLYFGIRYDEESIFFELSFKTMTSVHNSPIGLDLPLVDIYMDINHRAGAGMTRALPGREFFVDAKDAWEYCINLNGWGVRLYRSYSRSNYRKVEAVVSAHAEPEKNMVTITVSRKSLRGNPINWGYVVAVMGNDRGNDMLPPQPLRVVNNPEREHVFRGTWPGFVPPPVIDVLTPRGEEQQDILRVYRKRIPVILQAVRVKG